jgi:hypothetical protein
VTVSLNAAGRKLLAARGRLAVRLTVAGKGIRARHRTVTFKRKRTR